MITGKLYDWLKWIAQVVLPALGTLIFTVFQTWGIPHGTEILGTIIAVDLFLGVILGISQVAYSKAVAHAGDLYISEDGKKSFELDADKTDLDTLGEKKEVRFKVKKRNGGETE